MVFYSNFCFCKGTNGKGKEKKKQQWRNFSLKELRAATNNFNYDNKLSDGGFGSVYWGQLWNGSQIAVERLVVWSDRAEMQFNVEVEILGSVRHKNLLSFRGYCAEEQEWLIVYDHMPNGSLHSHLYGQHSAGCLLDWEKRMNIAIGSAEGIAYLHHHAMPRIIHRDIKASNVLLDQTFQARVADFGFAKLFPDGVTYVITKVKGTLGHLAPEYSMLGMVSDSCDVYSYGILLLELASGKKSLEKLSGTMKQSITDWALPLVIEKKFNEVADPKLNGKYVEEELKRLVLIALLCTQSQPKKRPTMLEVVDLLKGTSSKVKKLSDLEKDKMFRVNQAAHSQDGLPGPNYSSEDKDIQEL